MFLLWQLIFSYQLKRYVYFAGFLLGICLLCLLDTYNCNNNAQQFLQLRVKPSFLPMKEDTTQLVFVLLHRMKFFDKFSNAFLKAIVEC